MLGKHSGRHALQQALGELGFEVDGQALNIAFKRFKEIADKKKQVTAMDLEALVTDELREQVAAATRSSGSTSRPPRAGRRTPPSRSRDPDGEPLVGSFTGDGPVDAIFHAINAATGADAKLREFRVEAVTGGQDALGETSVVVELGGATEPARRSSAPGRASPPTSSRRRHAPTCGPCRAPCAGAASRRKPRPRPRRRPPRRASPLRELSPEGARRAGIRASAGRRSRDAQARANASPWR